MDPIKVVKLCKQNCIQKDYPLFLEDYQNYHAKTKGNSPLKLFTSLTEKEQNDFYKFIFYENRLNEISNVELQYSMFCILLENGSTKTKSLLQEALDMQPQQQLTCRNIQALKQLENNKNFVDQIKKLPKFFKPYSKLQKSDSDDSFSSDTTCDDEDSVVAKRLESSEQVLKVQTLLKKQGYKVETDGIYNAETENVIREYQQKNNLYVDGVITQNLINKLEGVQKKEENQSPSNNIGGINLKSKLKEVTHIRGLKLDKKNQLKFLVDKKDKVEFSGVDSDDLALCLRVYYDQAITNKVISFSLDPWEESKPEGEFQRKVLYPDILEKKKIISGTKFSELMFECDYLLKQMSLGLLPDCKTPFPYPPELVKLGLKPLSSIIEYLTQSKLAPKHNWSRLWLVCRKIEGFVDQNKKGVFLTNDVKIEVDARQMEQDSQGKLVDKVIQDQTDPCYIFAKKFSELYPVISKYYPCFEQLKKLYRASALARWIASNGINIDISKVNSACERQFSSVKKYNEKVNSIRNTQEIDIGVIERKIPVDVKIVAERSLKQSGQEVNEKNIKLAVEYLIKQNGSDQFFDIQRGKQIQSKFVMGGVDMNCQISPIGSNPPTPQSNKSQKSPTSNEVTFSKVQTSSAQNTPKQKAVETKGLVTTQKEKAKPEEKKIDDITSNYDDEPDYYSSASTSITSLDDNIIQQQVREEDFVFSLQNNCEKCKKNLTAQEQMYPMEQKYYCTLHHPYSCFYCGKLIQEQAATIKGRADLYDSDSFKDKQVHMHLDCNLIFQSRCVDKLNTERQNQEIQRVNQKVMEQIQKNLPLKKKIEEMVMKQGKTFTCDLCKKNNKNSKQINCSLCGLVNSEQANAFLKENFPTK